MNWIINLIKAAALANTARRRGRLKDEQAQKREMERIAMAERFAFGPRYQYR